MPTGTVQYSGLAIKNNHNPISHPSITTQTSTIVSWLNKKIQEEELQEIAESSCLQKIISMKTKQNSKKILQSQKKSCKLKKKKKHFYSHISFW